MRYPIHERFHTWQGEGAHAGRSAYFIRTFGCPVHCPWCDSAGTWHPAYVPERVERLGPAELAAEAAATRAEFTVLTGGEPAIHDLRPLTAALADAGQPAHVETSGAFVPRGDFAWVTVSPKRWQLPAAEALARADELKIVVDGPGAIDEFERLAGPLADFPAVWLQPEWSRAGDAAVLEAINRCVRDRGAPFRAGWQLHKLYAVDSEAAGSRAAAPLGGDPALGY